MYDFKLARETRSVHSKAGNVTYQDEVACLRNKHGQIVATFSLVGKFNNTANRILDSRGIGHRTLVFWE